MLSESPVMTRFSAETSTAKLAGSSVVYVETGARIHLGFYCPGRYGGRYFGGLGLYVDGLGYMLTVEFVEDTERTQSRLAVEAAGCQHERARKFALEAASSFEFSGTIRVRVEQCIPEHVGLGSTTQLKLSLYSAVAVYMGYDVREAVARAQRGPFSGVGSGAFLYGGLVVDAGVRPGETIARPMFRGEVPEEWWIVAILPETQRAPVEEGASEDRMMFEATGMDDTCRRGLEALVRLVGPGIAERDFELFVRGLEVIEEITSRTFAQAQGGSFCCTESEEAARILREYGARGVGQSSWGPLVYGFFRSPGEALRAADDLADIYARERIYVLKPRNRGARIELR